MTPLEQQAREAGEEIANSLFTHRSVFWDRCATDCAKAYLAAAEPREREIEALRAKVRELEERIRRITALKIPPIPVPETEG